VKIALVSEFFYPTVGGTQSAVARIAEGLAALGHDVVVFAPLAHHEVTPAQPATAYQTHWIRRPRLTVIGYLFWQLALYWRLRPFAVVHLFHPAFGLGAFLGKTIAGRRLVVTLMGYDTYDFSRMPLLKRMITLQVTAKADVVTAPSEDMTRLARDVGIVRNIAIIPHGIEARRPPSSEVTELGSSLALQEGQVVFVAVQRLYPVKEPWVLLKAWQLLARPDACLVIVGGGPLEGEVRDSLALQHLDNVIVVGEIAQARVPCFLALGDVFVHHSRYESFGLSVLEAMSAGLPIIASRVGALPELVRHGVDGLLVPPSDPPALARAMGLLLEDSELRRRMAVAAGERAGLYSWKAVVMGYEKAYGDAASL
jgi:glycosyltransferase involved in cell wall biosynthesis